MKLLLIEQRLFDLQSSNFIHIIVKPSSFTLTLIQGQILILKVTTTFLPIKQRLFDLESANWVQIFLAVSPVTLTLTKGHSFDFKVITVFC